MLFDTAEFMFLFLPIVLAGYFILGRIRHRAAAVWLIVASFAFYAAWNPPFVFLLATSVAINYTFGFLIHKFSERRSLQSAVFTIAVVVNLLALVFFKYLFPLLDWLASLGLYIPHSVDQVTLPLGISFFTFTQLGYLIDMKAGGIKEHSPLNYILFVTFFPHLIAGPILHHREMMPQFARPETYRFNPDDVSAGVLLFVIGLAKKRFIADKMAPLAELAFAHPHDLTMPVAWLGLLGYSLQLYFDFSGYSDMAIGLARIFGIRFPLNFNSPYKATNIIDFWQRWHMTLTRYITAYLYNPAVMWATRRRLARGQKVSRAAQATPLGFVTMIALPMFYTMGLAGVWHGAGLQYLIFGLLHGLYLTTNHAWRIFRAPASGPRATVAKHAWPVTVLCVLLTYVAVLVGQVFFRANSAGDAVHLLAGLSGLHGLRFDSTVMESLKGSSNVRVWAAYIAACYFIAWALPNSNELVARYERLSLNPAFQGALYAALICIVVVGASGPPVTFLYFQF